MTTTVTADEAEAHIRELLAQVEEGDEVIIARDGHPIARLVPDAILSSDESAVVVGRSGRLFGTARSKYGPLKPGWDDPMREEEIAQFDESVLFPEQGS